VHEQIHPSPEFVKFADVLTHRSGGPRYQVGSWPVAGDSKPNPAMRGTHQSTNLE